MTAVRISDVARAAGVSPATVSRVLNANGTVADELRRRVMTAVNELGFTPNSQARSLRTRATTVLGLVISDITNPFFTSMVRGVEDVASAAGYSVVLANTDEDLAKERRYLEVALAERMAGVALAPASSADTDITLLTDRGVPVVTIDRRLTSVEVDSVTIDNHRAAREATEHLAAQGYRRIGFVTGPLATTTAAERLAGYLDGLAAAGLDRTKPLVGNGDFRIEGGRGATHALLAQTPRPDALFVSNNLMTIGAVQALDEAGLSFPRDLGLVGFDDQSYVMGLRPPLTLISQPTYAIGEQAARLLLDRVGGDASPARRVVFDAELTVRGSSVRR
jgi:LacI family transcriptional regulator